ncbi:cellulose-binding family II [Actinoplanes sp. N902-109]|uniref:carbohydrate-binding protein n=1 Tax=Actinoplanes sp. (strain N902-109) TaxID=649831 RepID=UPI00032946ED|nr:cellulose-binding family II [Actinoplanes sp. N902-109]AGL20677.1 cellulose-binding family II [Actinoplanes sp. N902-109]
MKLKRKVLIGAAVASTAAAAAIIPMTASNAAVACVSAWSAGAVYTGGQTASQNSHNYTAKWWTQNESPATHSGQWDVWTDNGACGGGTTPTTPPTTTPPTTTPPSSGSKMASAPYVYPGWGNPPAPSTVVSATGIKAFTMAFVNSSGGCNPAWDSESGLTGGVHASYISQIKAAGADVIPSIGGWSGTKLGPNCATTSDLAGAYQKVINAFSLKAIDIDIENTDEFENTAVQDKILGALKIIKQNNPSVKTIVTFGTSTTGPNYYGTRLVQQAKALGANIDVFTQMPFDFGATDIYSATVATSEGLKNLLKTTFGYTDAQAYSHMGISGMNGLSDQQELTSTDTWTKIRDYARTNGFARFTFWSVNRDRGCAGGGVVSDCSGIAQADWAFTKISAGF